MTALSWEEWNTGGGPRYPHEKVVQFCLRSFPTAGRASVHALDLGCGSGANTLFLAAEGFRVSAVDISEAGVSNTRRRLKDVGLKADVRVGAIDALGFAPDSFDLVICVGVFDSAGPRASSGALGRLIELMKPGALGLFLFASDEDYRVVGENPLGLHGYPREEVDRLFACGFAQVDRDVYISTYRGGKMLQKDWLVTVCR